LSKKLRQVLLTVLIALLTLGLLLGVYFIYNQFFVNQPLSAALDNSTLIAKYKLTQKNKNPVLKVKLMQVADFATEFQNFLIKSDGILTDKHLVVEIYSNPNQRITDFYQEIHPSVYEALFLGNYSELQEKLKDEADKLKLSKVGLTITEDFLYLQLEDNKNYLYYMFNRHENVFPKIVNMGSDMI